VIPHNFQQKFIQDLKQVLLAWSN